MQPAIHGPRAVRVARSPGCRRAARLLRHPAIHGCSAGGRHNGLQARGVTRTTRVIDVAGATLDNLLIANLIFNIHLVTVYYNDF